MVLVIVRGATGPEFAFETTVACRVCDLCRDLCAIRSRAAAIRRFGARVDALLLLPSSAATAEQSQSQSQSPVPPHVAEMLARVAAEARALVAPAQAERRVALTAAQLDEALAAARSAAALSGTDGLPIAVECDADDAADAETRVWWAGRELDGKRTLADYVGRNEKTTVAVRLGRSGVPPATEAAPAAAPAATVASEQQTLAAWRRRRDEVERLDADQDDSFLASQWADPHGLKRQLTGCTDVNWRV